MESFQRNPNGGNNSSAARAEEARKAKANRNMSAPDFEMRRSLRKPARGGVFLRALSASIWFDIYFLVESALPAAPKGEKMRARAISVNFARLQRIFRFFRSLVSAFPSRFFFVATKNKIQIFPCRSRSRFLISSRWQGATAVNVNKM
jgi:hypothetical protein